jgi:single-stranded DNA-binding protein
MSARAIVSGVLFKAPIEKASKAGNPFATFTIRENHNGATRWWQCITFNENEIESLKAMTPGEPIAVCGEISAEIYAPAGSESRVNWRISVDAVLSARKPPKATPERTGRKPKEARRLDRAEASTGGSALAAASWASPSPLNDDIPFAAEWR